MIGGILIGLAIGLPLGWIIALGLVRTMFLSGRMTAAWVAEHADKLLAADDDEPEKPRGKRTL